MRRRIKEGISRALWSALAALGLPRERWLALAVPARRTIKAVLWIVVGLILTWTLGVWKSRRSQQRSSCSCSPFPGTDR